jgi:hypothetical protein
MYAVLISLFYALLSTMLLSANHFHSLHRNSCLSESGKYAVKGIAFTVLMYLTFLRIPFLIILMQGFLCGESTDVEYGLSTLTCDSTEH